MLADDLRKAGALVTDVVAYRTLAAEPQREGDPDVYKLLLERQVDAVTFTSASSVRHFVKALGEEQAPDLLSGTVVASIGPVTAEAAQQLGITSTIVPTEYTVPGLVQALVEHFRRQSAGLSRHDGRGGCAARRPCARWCARRACPPISSSTRCSSARATGVRRAVSSMPGVFQLSVDEAVREAAAARADGVGAVLLFGLPAAKDAEGSAAWDAQGAGAARGARASSPRCRTSLVITDVCLCEYTDARALRPARRRAHPQRSDRRAAGALGARRTPKPAPHIVAPSDMMDGRVGAIRQALDARGFEDVAILSYAAKYCSAFYGPFREAADSAPKFGDRRSHQMDPANVDEALREAALDVEEGADMVMVKPAVPYLDIVVAREARAAACRPRRTTSAANTRCSRRPPPTAGSTRRGRCWRRCSRSAAPAPTSSSPTTRATPRAS